MGERAVYYCRVSTEEENQLASLARQREEAKQAIREQGWELVEGYLDEGRSGTTTRHRTAYRQMNEDMEADRFDILVVKSQDRLMRNTREWYLFLDRLLRYRKKLYFYLERRFYTSEDALLTGIKALLAEDYSRSLSRNINHAHERRQRTGSNVVLTSGTWGYDKRNRQVVVNEEEARMIRLIFTWAAEDYGSRIIAGRLAELGYRNRKGGRLAEQTIRRILRNPLYKGTARMHTQHRDFETKQVERLDREQWIYHEGAVPAIVSAELWETANRLMDSRRQREEGRNRQEGKEQGKGRQTEAEEKYPYLFSGKICCGLCQSAYWRRTRTVVSGKKHVWSCSCLLEAGRKGCQNIHLSEEDLERKVLPLLEKQGYLPEQLTGIRVYPSYLELELQEPKPGFPQGGGFLVQQERQKQEEQQEKTGWQEKQEETWRGETKQRLLRVEIQNISSRKRDYQIRL